MVICGSYMFEFNINKNMKKMDIIREVAVGKVAVTDYTQCNHCV